MIKCEHCHADRDGQDERNSIQQQLRTDLLYDHNVKESIHQFRCVLAIKRLHARSRKPKGQFCCDSREQSPLDDFHDDRLNGFQRRLKNEKREQHE